MHEVKDSVDVKPNVLQSVLKNKPKDGNIDENSKNKRVVFQDKAVILNKSPPKPSDTTTAKQATHQDKPKDKKDRIRPPTKVVVRRLPPSLTLEAFVDCVSPLPEHDYIYFVAADMSLGANAFSRVYINFINMADLITFHEQFDNYVFMDNKGNEYPAVVEFAPFQRIPKKRPVKKKDLKAGTLNEDAEYIAFLEMLKEKKEANAVKHSSIDILIPSDKTSKKVTTTPLLDYIKQRRAEQQRIRDEKREERRKRELERKRIREEEKKKRKDGDSVLKVLRNSETEEGEEEKSVKENKEDNDRQSSPLPQQNKRKEEEKIKFREKEKKDQTPDNRTRDVKGREGGPKSYRDERQKLAEGRMQRKLADDQRKKTASQSSSKIIDIRRTQEVDKSGGIREISARKTQMYSKENDGKKFSSDKFKENDKQSRETESKKSFNSRDYESKRSERYQGYEYRKSSFSSDGKKSPYSASESRNRSADHKIKVKENDTSQNKNLIAEDEDEKWEQMGAKPKLKVKPERQQDENSETEDSETSSKTKEDIGNLKSSSILETGKSEKGLGIDIIDITHQDTEIANDMNMGNNMKDSRNGSNESENRSNFDGASESSSLMQTKRCLIVSKSQEFDISSKSETIIFERRNSLDSKSQRETSKKCKFEAYTKEWCEDDKTADEDKEWHRKQSKDIEKNEHTDSRNGDPDPDKRDPRVERRIRNKTECNSCLDVCLYTAVQRRKADRPSMEIYRPGMGRFSMQRKEREKGGNLGSSAEQDSPSTSPSPSPSIRPTSVTRNKPGQELRSMTFKRSVSREK